MLELVLKLFLAHIVGDFVFQPNKWVKSKEDKKYKSPYLYWHILIHTIALLIALQFNFNYWLGILIIVCSHYLIDLSKLYLIKKINVRWLFLWDQLAHLVVIFGVVRIYEIYEVDVSIFYKPQLLLFIIAVLLVTIVASIVMKLIISKWELNSNSNEMSLNDAGKYIGILERLFIFVFIITNNWQGIGFLLAAKSVFRFGDLSRSEDRKLTEYILIGTLLSFGLAILVGMGYNYIITTKL
ncbi:DUF3307 domain-containing protein [uncultured Lutibacter sp.]|uniref:DUF3307 domain-containing protein n=1 Tax=uncultured Lutibacter sp. TaxID=437739 RepID=UPI002625ADDC|nr:DUF3307 domain-containing protein [uncultured Lutibacter sp.]